MEDKQDQVPLTEEQDQAPLQDQASRQDQEKSLLEQIEAKYKAQIAGLDRKTEELRQALEQERLSKLSEEERIKKEAEMQLTKAKEERDAIIAETKELKRQSLVSKALADAGLPLDFARRIGGETEAEIAEDIKALKTLIDGQVAKSTEAEIAKRLAGKEPAGGSDEKKMTFEEIEKIPDRKKRVELYKKHGYVK